MYAEAFDYVRCSSWSEAVARLAEGGQDARLLAGGQSLVPMMMLRVASPSVLIDIGGIEPGSIERRDGRLVVSALARHVDLERSSVVRDACPLLAEAAELIGNVRVRHRGTIGGSLAHAEPTAELPCAVVATGATVHALGPSGERAIPADELFVSHLTTSLQPAEVITRVELPVLRENEGTSFMEAAHRPGDFAMAEVAAALTVADDGAVVDARVAVGAVSDRPLDVSAVASVLLGQRMVDELAAEVGGLVASEVEVGPSSQASEQYRRAMVAVLVKRALRTAAARALDRREPRAEG